jgi:putative acetyltransferase
MRQASKAELILVSQRVCAMKKYAPHMQASIQDELRALGITSGMPWEAASRTPARRSSPAGVTIRRETGADASAVAELLRAAFGTSVEASLVERLRELPSHDPSLFLVAVAGGRVVGHIALSHVECPGAAHPTVALGPLAVLEPWRRNGIAACLVLHGMDRCRGRGVGAVWVQGSVAYYRRFGFRLLSKAWPRISTPWQLARHDMGLELIPGTLDSAGGPIAYPSHAWLPLMDVPAALESIGEATRQDASSRSTARESAA